MGTRGPFGYAQGRLFDSARLTPHFAQDDNAKNCRQELPRLFAEITCTGRRAHEAEGN